MKDNRKDKRYLHHGVIDLEIRNGRKRGSLIKGYEKVIGFIYDISRSGIGVLTLNPLTRGDRVVVKKVQLMKRDIETDIPATVLWTRTVDNRQRFGISLEKEIRVMSGDIEVQE